jgi:integrase
MYATMARQHISGSKIGAQPLDKLRPSHIEAWKVELEHRGLSESTIRSAYTSLRAVLDTAVRDRALAQNPALAVRRPRVPVTEAAYLTPDQVRSLLLAAKPSRYAPVFELLVIPDYAAAKRSPCIGPTLILRRSCCVYAARSLESPTSSL